MHATSKKPLQVFTIGHSNRTAEEFLSLLKEFHIETLCDIRRFPGSRKFPHFNRELLAETLKTNGINYVWLEALGGRRGGVKHSESKNMGLKSLAFRNYADYMATNEFLAAIGELLKTAAASTTTIMCAEVLYWRCHRKLVSDYLTAHDVKVTHILDHGKLLEHKMADGAVMNTTGDVTYPLEKHTGSLFGFD